MPPELITYRRAAAMRRALTPPEATLWLQLKGRGLEGWKFRRQHPVGPYILDFYCPAARLAVEVDGAGHDHPDQLAHDERRTEWLAARNIRVLRLQASDVKRNLEAVLLRVLAELRAS
jgi:very-short-patch-repair endonuclease